MQKQSEDKDIFQRNQKTLHTYYIYLQKKKSMIIKVRKYKKDFFSLYYPYVIVIIYLKQFNYQTASK